MHLESLVVLAAPRGIRAKSQTNGLEIRPFLHWYRRTWYPFTGARYFLSYNSIDASFTHIV